MISFNDGARVQVCPPALMPATSDSTMNIGQCQRNHETTKSSPKRHVADLTQWVNNTRFSSGVLSPGVGATPDCTCRTSDRSVVWGSTRTAVSHSERVVDNTLGAILHASAI